MSLPCTGMAEWQDDGGGGVYDDELLFIIIHYHFVSYSKQYCFSGLIELQRMKLQSMVWEFLKAWLLEFQSMHFRMIQMFGQILENLILKGFYISAKIYRKVLFHIVAWDVMINVLITQYLSDNIKTRSKYVKLHIIGKTDCTQS